MTTDTKQILKNENPIQSSWTWWSGWIYFLWDSGCTNNEIGELFEVSYSREQIHCYENIVGGFGAKILALIHPTLLQFLWHLHINVFLAFLLNSAQDSVLKAVIVLGVVWPKTYFLFLFPSSFTETRIRSFDKESKYCTSASSSLSESLSKPGILFRVP